MKRFHKKVYDTLPKGVRKASKEDFFTVHPGFDNYYFPHLGMRYIIYDDGKYIEIKLYKMYQYDTDIKPFVDSGRVFVYSAETSYYKARLSKMGECFLYRNLLKYGYIKS